MPRARRVAPLTCADILVQVDAPACCAMCHADPAEGRDCVLPNGRPANLCCRVFLWLIARLDAVAV